MEDVTEEEWVALVDYLEELRRSKEEGGYEEWWVLGICFGLFLLLTYLDLQPAIY